MRLTTTLAAGATWAALALVGPAIAGAPGSHPGYRLQRALPPVSGTLRLEPHAFGRGSMSRSAAFTSREWAGAARPHRAFGPSYGHQAGYSRFGQRGPGAQPFRAHRYGPAYGYQGQARAQFANAYGGSASGRFTRSAVRYGYQFSSRPRELTWRGDGTGLVGLIGNAGPNYNLASTGWGTADSATTGGGYPLPSPYSRYHAEAPVQVTYGEPDLWTSGAGYPPTGGLAYYNSGSPGRMAYYSSSSSAGPYGTPGGLGIYSSGSYGPGPHIIRVGQRHHRRFASEQDCACGPRIISRHRWHQARW